MDTISNLRDKNIYKYVEFSLNPRTKEIAKEIYNLEYISAGERLAMMSFFAKLTGDNRGIRAAQNSFRSFLALEIANILPERMIDINKKDGKAFKLIAKNKAWKAVEKWADNQDLKSIKIDLSTGRKKIEKLSPQTKDLLISAVGVEFVITDKKPIMILLNNQERKQKIIEGMDRVYFESMANVKKAFEDGTAQKIMDELGIQRIR